MQQEQQQLSITPAELQAVGGFLLAARAAILIDRGDAAITALDTAQSLLDRVGGPQRRALVEQHLRHRRVAFLRGDDQRDMAVLECLVDRRALVEQQLHHRLVALLRGPHQRCPPILSTWTGRR